MKDYYVGIDTSAYTTSLAVVSSDNEIIADYREILKVKEGNRGLRQQEAVFQHVLNLPNMIDKLASEIDVGRIKAISASIKPRNIENSYMPVFRVSQGQAYVLSKVLGVPYYEFSHQDGHIASGLLNNKSMANKFIALHISGGTTELLLVEDKLGEYDVQIIGGTKDISAGQLVDRIGVSFGLNFPCGSMLDKVSANGELIKQKLPISTHNTWINFSGAETFFQRLISSQSHKNEHIAYSLFHVIGKSLSQIIRNGISNYGVKDVLIIGGVASNTLIRNILGEDIDGKNFDGNVYFTDPKLCSDNAVGIAYLGRLKKI